MTLNLFKNTPTWLRRALGLVDVDLPAYLDTAAVQAVVEIFQSGYSNQDLRVLDTATQFSAPVLVAPSAPAAIVTSAQDVVVIPALLATNRDGVARACSLQLLNVTPASAPLSLTLIHSRNLNAASTLQLPNTDESAATGTNGGVADSFWPLVVPPNFILQEIVAGNIRYQGYCWVIPFGARPR